MLNKTTLQAFSFMFGLILSFGAHANGNIRGYNLTER